jgi:hypothetical protein
MSASDHPFATQQQHQAALELVRRLDGRVSALEAVLLTVADTMESMLDDPENAREHAKQLRASVMTLGPGNP